MYLGYLLVGVVNMINISSCCSIKVDFGLFRHRIIVGVPFNDLGGFGFRMIVGVCG